MMPERSSKKLSLVLALTACFALFPVTALASEPMSAALEAPSNVIVSESLDENYKYVYVTFNKSADLSAMIDGGTATAEKYGLDTSFLEYYIQIDWSIDSQDDWKYVPGWDELKTHTGDAWFEGEYTNKTLESATTERASIFDFNFNADPNSSKWQQWLTFLKDGQYAIVDGEPFIDWTQHTIYVRARFVVQYKPIGGSVQYLISDWSQISGYGKDYKPFEIPKSLEAPVISDLKLTDRQVNGGPVAAFNLANPQSVKDASAGAQSLTDYIIVVAEVSIDGGEWTEVNLSTRDITDGYLDAELARVAESVSEDTHVRLRARYQYHKGDGTLVLSSDWSDVVEFGTPAWDNASQTDTAKQTNADTAATPAPEDGKAEAGECIIHTFLDFAPLGLCACMWIILLLVLLVIILILCLCLRKRK